TSADDAIGRGAKVMLICGFLYLAPIITSLAAGEPLNYFNLAFVAFYLFVGLWDYLVYQRRVISRSDLSPGRMNEALTDSPTKGEATPSPSPDPVQAPASGPDTSPFALIEEPTLRLGPIKSGNLDRG